MTRLLQPPEEGWRGRFSFIQQILRSAFRLPDQTESGLSAPDDIGRGGHEGGDQAEAAKSVSDRSGDRRG